jgi:integrase
VSGEANGKQIEKQGDYVVKLTKNAIATLQLPPGKSEHFEWDDDLPGFGVRLRGERASWIVQYRIGSQQRRESLGDIRKVTLKAAREIAGQRFAHVELGTDPAAEKAKARAAEKGQKLTFEVVAKQYLASKKGVVRDATYVAAEHDLLTLWKPFAKRPIDSIKRADIALRLREIVVECSTSKRALRIKEGLRGKTAASRARSNASAMFVWAMGEGMVENNPTIATNNPAEGINARERVLANNELAVVWRACENDDFGRIVKLLILTGCRREEIGGLKWSEIDLDTEIMSIPGTRTKNHKTHTLILPAAAVEILRSAPHREGREFIFGGRGGSFSAWSYATAAMHVRIATAEGKPLPHWSLHDLRRTMRTGLGQIGIAPHIAERVINHTRGGVEAIYDRFQYQPEIKAALARWADHVLAVVEKRETNVTPLRRA